jgi:hypothetical protein
MGRVRPISGGGCCRTFRMSVAASSKMSTRKRSFRVLGGLAVVTLSAGCSR